MRFLAFIATICLFFGFWVSLAQDEEEWPEPPFGPEAVGVVAGLSTDDAMKLSAELSAIYRDGDALYEQLESGKLNEEQRRSALKEIRKTIRRYEQVVRQNLTADQIAVAREWGDQPERYARRVVWQLPGLSREKRSVLRYLDEIITTRLNDEDDDEDSEEKNEGLEQRYWMTVALIVGPQNWAALRASLPHQYQQEFSEEDLLTLDGMTGAKANSIWAEIKAFEAEMIATRAEIDRLEMGWKDLKTEDERAASEQQAEALHTEVEQREKKLREDVMAKLSDEDRQQMNAFPPMIPLIELVENLEPAIERVKWSDEQQRWLDSQIDKVSEQEEAIDSKMEMMEKQMDEGEEDPEKTGDLTHQVQYHQLMKPVTMARLDVAHQAFSKLSRAQLREFILLGEMPEE